MSEIVTVNKRGQVTLPAALRRKLGIDPGQRLCVTERNGVAIMVVIPEAQDYVGRMSGLHSHIWEGIEPTEFLRREREAWRD